MSSVLFFLSQNVPREDLVPTASWNVAVKIMALATEWRGRVSAVQATMGIYVNMVRTEHAHKHKEWPPLLSKNISVSHVVAQHPALLMLFVYVVFFLFLYFLFTVAEVLNEVKAVWEIAVHVVKKNVHMKHLSSI